MAEKNETFCQSSFFFINPHVLFFCHGFYEIIAYQMGFGLLGAVSFKRGIAQVPPSLPYLTRRGGGQSMPIKSLPAPILNLKTFHHP